MFLIGWLFLKLPKTGPLFDRYGTGGWVSAYYRWKEKMEPRVIAWHKARRDKHQAVLNQLDPHEATRTGEFASVQLS